MQYPLYKHICNCSCHRLSYLSDQFRPSVAQDVYKRQELLSVTMNDGVKPRSDIEGKDNSSEDKSNYKIVRKGDMVYNSMRM